jgi:hypothetical protein
MVNDKAIPQFVPHGDCYRVGCDRRVYLSGGACWRLWGADGVSRSKRTRCLVGNGPTVSFGCVVSSPIFVSRASFAFVCTIHEYQRFPFDL